MRALAMYAMRGRNEAVLAAMATTAVPLLFWIGAAVIGLVILRRGVRDGVFVLACAAGPALAYAALGDIQPLATVLGAGLLAWLLRWSVSWPWALCGASAIGLAMSTMLYTVARGHLAEIEKAFAELLGAMTRQAAEPSVVASLQAPSGAVIAGMYGVTLSVSVVGCLLLARYWQSALYNPGGLRTEMHSLRIGGPAVLGLLGTAALLMQLGADFRLWAWVPLLPMFVAGIGLVHALCARKAGAGWLGLFYAALLLLPPFKHLVVALAAADGWLNLRRRLISKPPPGDGDGKS